MKILLLALLGAAMLYGQRPVSPNQINQVTGTGNELVTSHGVPTPGCVNIDANGDFVSTGTACPTGSGATITSTTHVICGNGSGNGALCSPDLTPGSLATTASVADAIASVNPAVAVEAATTAVLSNSPTYSNGTAGVGATLTAGSNGALTIDGYTVLLNDRVLIKTQASALQNGVYTLTTLGTGGVPYVLTRAADYNSASNINYTGTTPVINGTTNANTGWNLTTQIATVGTDSISYVAAATTTPPGGNVKGTGNFATGNVITGAGGKTIQDSGVAFSAVARSNAATTVNGQTCTLGSTCTISATNITTGTLPAAQTAAALSNTTSVNGTTIPSSATLTQTIGSGTITLGTSAIASGACSSTATVTITGTASTDAFFANVNGDPTAVTGYVPSTNGSLYIWVWPTTNTVNAKACNNTSASITPGSAIVLNVRVAR